MCWEERGAYHSLTNRGHQVPLCHAILDQLRGKVRGKKIRMRRSWKYSSSQFFCFPPTPIKSLKWMTLPCWCSWSLGLTSDRLRPTTSRLSVGSYLTQATKCTLTSEKDKHHFPHDGLALDIIKIIFDNAAFLFNSWKREPGQSAAAEHCSHSHERSWIISELKVYSYIGLSCFLEMNREL